MRLGEFTTRFVLERVIGSADTWYLEIPLGYLSTLVGELFTIPARFKTDFASIPRCVHWLLPKNGEYDAPAVLHDWLYAMGITDRETADYIFLEAMESINVPAWKRALIFGAVRKFGWKAWNEHRKANNVASVV